LYLPYTRDTEENILSQEYRAGFNTSPWSRLSFGASYRHSDRRTDYARTNVFAPDDYYLYPAFLLWRDIQDDRIEARVSWHAASWLKASFTYRWQETDFDSATAQPSATGDLIPVDAALQKAIVYSFNATVTPWKRLYLSGTFSYSDSSIAAAQNGASYIVPWRGHVYGVLASATFALNPKTDLHAAYVYSLSQYGQDNQATGLPAGIDYERHSVHAGMTHRFSSRVIGNVSYSFAQYREPTLGGADNYTANGIFASVTLPLR
jgi:hypothetical protein